MVMLTFLLDCKLNTHFVELNDESYLHDGVPLPISLADK